LHVQNHSKITGQVKSQNLNKPNKGAKMAFCISVSRRKEHKVSLQVRQAPADRESIRGQHAKQLQTSLDSFDRSKALGPAYENEKLSPNFYRELSSIISAAQIKLHNPKEE
jgi:hypothetical protein